MMTKKSIIILVMGLLGTEIAWKVWKYVRRRGSVVDEKECVNKRELLPVDREDVIMFTGNGKQCRDHANTRIPCEKTGCPVGNVEKIYRYLSGASKTLDVCMYMMTCDDLTEAILRSHRRGATVRIILDSGMSENSACNKQILKIRRAGIEIRMNEMQPSSLMHHKFAVIDGKFLLFGSTNWTMQAFYGNNDSMIVTSSKVCLTEYSKEFDEMWRNFDF